MNQLFTFVLLLGSFFSSIYSVSAVADNTPIPKGAVCVVDDGFRIVLIEELITGKLSLPGGVIDEGETPKEAAERETWEETGLVVTAQDVLYQDDKAIVYSCKSESDIVVFNLQTIDGFFRIPSWFAPHYGIETEAVYLTEPYKINVNKYRYPEQLELLQQWFSKPQESRNQISWVTDLVDQASGIHKVELELLTSLRSSIDSLPAIINISIKIFFTVINETGTEAFFYFLFIVALVYFGRETGLTLLFGIVLTILFSDLIRQGLSLPRPFVYVPQLQLTQANGFGMPSMNSMLATVIYGIFYLALKRKPVSPLILQRFGLFFIGLIIAQAVARVWLGIHFLSDSVVGIALGAMIIVHFANLQKKHGDLLYRVMGSLSFWLLMSVVTSGIAFIMEYMNYLYMASICWGAVLAIYLSKGLPILNVKDRLITLFTLLITVILTRFGTSFLLGILENSSMTVLAVKSMANLLLILMILVLSAWLPKVLNKLKNKS